MEGIPFDRLLHRYPPGHRRYVRQVKRRRLKIYLRPLFRRTYPTRERFILLSQMRSGSHLVRSLVNAHPSVHCDAEIFATVPTVIPRLLLKNAMGAREEPVYGFMLKPNHPAITQGSTTAHWIEWMQHEGFKLVHVQREDRLRQALSCHLAIQRQVWIVKKGVSKGVQPLRIDPEEILGIRTFIDSWKDSEEEWVSTLPSISFSYERDLESPERHQETADAIFDFLGLESVPVAAQIQRVLPPDPREYVTNWEEVAAAWEGGG
jgi:hypothetical protein